MHERAFHAHLVFICFNVGSFGLVILEASLEAIYLTDSVSNFNWCNVQQQVLVFLEVSISECITDSKEYV